LSDAACEEVKRKYIFDSENLKVIMILMKDSSLSISTEAFRIFRVHKSVAVINFNTCLIRCLLTIRQSRRACMISW
jgi:hypothetical protein